MAEVSGVCVTMQQEVGESAKPNRRFIIGSYYSLDWTTGLEYWTDIFLAFTQAVVSSIDSYW